MMKKVEELNSSIENCASVMYSDELDDYNDRNASATSNNDVGKHDLIKTSQ